jgi:hypothetical protein
MSGIRRQVGTDQLRRAAPLELEPIELVLAPIDTATLAGQRDRALLLGFAARSGAPSSSPWTSRISSSTPLAD